jgi:SAM-dependent methyltransferase
MENNDYIEKNRAAWNEVAPIHKQQRKTDLSIAVQAADYNHLGDIEMRALNKIGLQGKNIAHLCCNNGIELISMLKQGAAHGIGFDISDAFVEEANRLAGFAGVNGEFVRTNVLEIPETYDNMFDVVVFTIGGIIWIADLPKLFAVSRRLLKPGGHLFIYDQHPFLNLFADETEPGYDAQNELKIVYPYFNDQPWVSTDGLDYIGGTIYKGKESVCFAHTFSDILSAVIDNGFILTEFKEFPQDISNSFERLEKYNKIPMCYLLTARAEE